MLNWLQEVGMSDSPKVNINDASDFFQKKLEEAKSLEEVIFPLGHSKNPKGGSFDITPNGKFARTRERARILVIHWGSHSAQQLAGYFRTTDRAVSAHWAVDETGCYQMLDNGLRAYHAGWINTHSVGFDIACQPVVDRLKDYQNRGRKIEIVQNPTSRGDRRILTLDPRIAENVRLMTWHLCAELGIPLQVPRDAKGKVRHDVVFRDARSLGNWSGVIGHHHCDSKKWDVAPWWGTLFDGTPLGD
jgi:hypothetical protein